MCRFISFFHNPLNGDIAASDLNSHGNTETNLKLNLNIWREAHYTSNGEIELRFNPTDVIPENYEEHFKERFPTFLSFFNHVITSCTKDGVFNGNLDLGRLTSAKDLVLPKTISGWLDLGGLNGQDRKYIRDKFGY